MQYWQKFLNYSKAHRIISGIVLVMILFGSYQWYTKAHTTTGTVQYITQLAQKTTISVAISATGQVASENKVDLKPGSTGALTQVNVKTGDKVKANQTLAVVDERANSVAVAQAQAQVLSTQANYDKLVGGLTGSDLITAQTTVSDAQKALDKAQRDYNSTVSQQQQAVAKAYSNLLNSGLELTASDQNTTTSITLSGTYTGTTEGQYQISTYIGGDGLYYQTAGLGNQSGVIKHGTTQPLGNGLYINFATSGIINSSTTWTIDVPNKASSTYSTNNYAYATALQNQTDALISAQDTIDSAQENLDKAQRSLADSTAAPANADVASARASVLSAQASLQNADLNYQNNMLKTPFDGIVAVVNNQKGDQVTSSTVVMTVITNEQLATVSLNELDVAKVQVGQKVNLTFDAISDLNLTGEVVEVDSLGTVSQGVVSYTVKIGFDTQDSRVKPSMSVAANVITNVKTDVLAVPNSAVKTNASGKYVQMLDSNGQPQNFPVEVGISNDTMTEITSGLSDGETIVTQTIAPTVAGASTTRTNTSTGIPGLGGTTSGAAGRTQFRGN